MEQLRADSYDSESRKSRIHRFAFAQRAIDCISSKSQVIWLYILIYEIPSNMMHPVDWKKIDTSSVPCVFLEMCCVSASLIKDTVTPVLLTFITDGEHFYVVWHFLVDWQKAI